MTEDNIRYYGVYKANPEGVYVDNLDNLIHIITDAANRVLHASAEGLNINEQTCLYDRRNNCFAEALHRQGDRVMILNKGEEKGIPGFRKEYDYVVRASNEFPSSELDSFKDSTIMFIGVRENPNKGLGQPPNVMHIQQQKKVVLNS